MKDYIIFFMFFEENKANNKKAFYLITQIQAVVFLPF